MHAFSKLYHADFVCLSKGQTSVVLSSIFCLNPVPNVYSTTPVEVFLELLFLTRNPSLLVLKIYGKAHFLKMLTDVDHDNLRIVLFQTPNSYLSFLFILEVQNPTFLPFHVFFEKSSNYDTKFVYFLTKAFSCCYLCCFWLKNVVSNSN